MSSCQRNDCPPFETEDTELNLHVFARQAEEHCCKKLYVTMEDIR